MSTTVPVYVRIPDEYGAMLTRAIPLENGLYKIMPTPDYDPKIEDWEFAPGSIVRCELVMWDELLFLAVEKVGQRLSFSANNSKIFAWDDPPPTDRPGEDFGCRCTAEPYVSPFLPNDPTINDPPLEPVYPEAIIPLLRIPRLIVAWRAWVLTRRASREWQLSKTKSEQKWATRMEKGNWTPEKITQTIKSGKQYKVKNERTGGAATRYELNDSYVVRDDTTGDILQLSGPEHIAKKF